MKRLVEISDTHDHVFLHMSDVLAALEPEASRLRWAILDLREAFAPEGSDFDVLAVERQVSASPGGKRVSFAELVDFAGHLLQIIDGLFVAAADATRLPTRADTDAVVLERSDIVLAAFDSTCWLLSAPEPILARVADRFRRKLGPAVVPRPRVSRWAGPAFSLAGEGTSVLRVQRTRP